jgi:hypothetical protein
MDDVLDAVIWGLVVPAAVIALVALFMAQLAMGGM